MALDGSKVLKVGRADFYTAPVGTALPTDLSKTPDKAWTHAGHSSIEDILAVSSDGGETTTLGSIQSPQLRQSTTPATRAFTVNFLQWDAATLKLYYGGNVTEQNGNLQIPQTPHPSEVAWLAVLQDGDNYGGIYAAKASAIGDGDLTISDSDSLAQLPVKFTPLSYNDSNFAFTFVPMKAKAPAA